MSDLLVYALRAFQVKQHLLILLNDQPIDCWMSKMVQNLLMIHLFPQYFDLWNDFEFLFYYFSGIVVICLLLGCLLWIDNLLHGTRYPQWD